MARAFTMDSDFSQQKAMTRLFKDRTDAGKQLANALRQYRGGDDVIVLALPRGGVPVGVEIARALKVPLDLMLVRKLGTPGQEELAMGAIASGGARVLNPNVISMLGIDQATIERVVKREEQELARRRRLYRGNRPEPGLAGKSIILVDDGIATGATMRVAIAALREARPASIIVAVPVAPPDTVAILKTEADAVICVLSPERLTAVGNYYQSFPQLDDAQVTRLLETAVPDDAEIH